MSDLYKYCLRLADTSFFLSHRLSEYSSNGPFLEEDLSITNVALDLIGQAESFYKYAAELDGSIDEDTLAFKRNEEEYLNFHLVEYPNEDFAFITARQFFMDVYNFYLYSELKNSKDETIAAIAAKSLKEVTYHVKRSSEWMLRLGDGTEESHDKIQAAVNDLWMYIPEMFDMDQTDENLIASGIAVDLGKIKEQWDTKVNATLEEATLTRPEDHVPSIVYGKNGGHSEYMGYILNDIQFLNNRYPKAVW